MARTGTDRNVRFNARFNWNDRKPETGYIQISGEGKANSMIAIHFRCWDPNNDAEKIGTDPVIGDYNIDNSQTIYLT